MKREKIEIMADFMTGLNTMTDAASQMVHQNQGHSFKWIGMRDMLHIIRDALEEQNPGMAGKK